jgi:membrane-associated protein
MVDPASIITYGGLALLVLVIFAETGLFFGFFLPGDSLLFTAGLLCGTGKFETNILTLVTSLILAAFLGNITGYFFGRKVGRALFEKKDSLFFKKEYIYVAENFYLRYGGMALILGRFLPVIRTFAPILAGVIKLNYTLFMTYNIAGSVLWVGSLVISGYYLGNTIPAVQEYLGYIVIGLIIITAIPVMRTYVVERRRHKEQKNQNQGKQQF